MTLQDLSYVYRGLKDFQRATVEHAANHLFGSGGTRRFLVADEVGLGKTLVAKGLVARAIEHHLELGTGRIDIVYICSNADIARQNVRKLNVIEGEQFAVATRLTLLPKLIRELETKRVNFVSFTPGTSFSVAEGMGRQDERAVLLNMLQSIWGNQVDWGLTASKVFAGGANWMNFHRYQVTKPENKDFDPALLRGFGDELARLAGGHDAIQEQYRRLWSAFKKGQDDRVRDERTRFIGGLREALARACVEALEPNLVIMDEFQRFKHIFDDEDPAGVLARALFDFPGASVLLLSATPYRMYTTTAESDEDHYADFLETVRFLVDGDDVAVKELGEDIADFRRAMFSPDSGAENLARAAKARIERRLSAVMSRTERLAATSDRSGMLELRPCRDLKLDPIQVRDFVTLDRVGSRIGQGGSMAYWESTPYPLSYLDDHYKFARSFITTVGNDGGAELADLPVEHLSIDWKDVERYERVDPRNARMRFLESDVIDRGLWRLLWLPSSLSYYSPGGPFSEAGLDSPTKRLVFSAWAVVPRAISSHISYETERRMMTLSGRAENTQAARDSFNGLLQLTKSAGALKGMPVLALLYPSPSLAELGDPLAVARELGALEHAASLDDVLSHVRERISYHLESLHARRSDRPDQRWYWAAPLLLDKRQNRTESEAWLADAELADRMRGDESAGGVKGLRAHLSEAVRLLQGEIKLGTKPDDLAEVVAEMAIAGPAVCALRAMLRSRSDLGRWDGQVRGVAASVAFALRSLFNRRDVTAMLQAGGGGHKEDVYWRQVLRYCLDGGLQAVMDEWTHVLVDALGLATVGPAEFVKTLGDEMRDAISIKTVPYSIKRVQRHDGRIRVKSGSMRAQMALPFGQKTSDADSQRAAAVRTAFNSPFRPFVLASTSVGQEGLDFHTYCHAVVHWNLPANPVDLEQREGRVHRYKGHAVRKNIASHFRGAAILADGDPWTAMFEAALSHREEEYDDVVPYWVFDKGAARIERYVPALPLSREERRFEELRVASAAYRLVFGQPRQEDLLRYLKEHGDRTGTDLFRIDLKPTTTGAALDGWGGVVDLSPIGRAERHAVWMLSVKGDPALYFGVAASQEVDEESMVARMQRWASDSPEPPEGLVSGDWNAIRDVIKDGSSQVAARRIEDAMSPDIAAAHVRRFAAGSAGGWLPDALRGVRPPVSDSDEPTIPNQLTTASITLDDDLFDFELADSAGEAAVLTARALRGWAQGRELGIRWGSQDLDPTFGVCLELERGDMFTVDTSGDVHINLGAMTEPPFHEEPGRTRLAIRLDRNAGLDIILSDKVNGFPTCPLERLASQDRLEGFLGVWEWYLDRVAELKVLGE